MVKFIKSVVNYVRCKAAIKKANMLKVTTGKKQLVLMLKGKPVVVSKNHLKHLIRQGHFNKGFTIETAERLAIYKTL